jgi:hypothetical protein
VFILSFVRVLLVVFVILTLLDELVGRAGYFSNEQESALSVFDGVEGIEKLSGNSPAISEVEVQLVSKRGGGDSLSTNNFMFSVVLIVNSLAETEAHFRNSCENRGEGPSAEFVLVIGDFTSEARNTLLVEFLGPLLSALVPFTETIEIHLLVSRSVPRVDGTSDDNTFGVSSLSFPKAVHVTNSSDNLVFVFDMWVLLVKLDRCLVLGLGGNDPRLVDASGFVHKLSSTRDSLVISGLVISLSGLSNGQLIKNVSLLTLVNEKPRINFLNL